MIIINEPMGQSHACHFGSDNAQYVRSHQGCSPRPVEIDKTRWRQIHPFAYNVFLHNDENMIHYKCLKFSMTIHIF